jgi:hypothetical protein
MYRTTGYTLSTLNKNVTDLILDYLSFTDLFHLTVTKKGMNDRITGYSVFNQRKSATLLQEIWGC